MHKCKSFLEAYMMQRAYFTPEQIQNALDAFLREDLKTASKTDRRKTPQPVLIKTRRREKKGN
jgi:hypothetical protein